MLLRQRKASAQTLRCIGLSPQPTLQHCTNSTLEAILNFVALQESEGRDRSLFEMIEPPRRHALELVAPDPERCGSVRERSAFQ